MQALIQRVSHASVHVAGALVGSIARGYLLLLCAEHGDSEREAERLLARVLKLRVFPDANGKMQHSLQDMDGQGTPGGLLVVSQFTLAADLSSGNRPSFTSAAPPELARAMFDHFVQCARKQHPVVQTGVFAAHMQVSLLNDGPVTIPLRVRALPDPH